MSDLTPRILKALEHQLYVPVAVEPYETTPPYVYTLGLQRSISCPELMLFGLNHALAGHIINEVVARLALHPYEPVLDGQTITLSEGGQVVLRHTAKIFSLGFLHEAEAYHKGLPNAPDLDVLQIVWPDHHDKFPWQKGYDYEALTLQPPCWVENPEISD